MYNVEQDPVAEIKFPLPISIQTPKEELSINRKTKRHFLSYIDTPNLKSIRVSNYQQDGSRFFVSYDNKKNKEKKRPPKTTGC